MGGETLRLEYPDGNALARDFEANLAKGRAFVAGSTSLRERDACQLLIVHPATGQELLLAAEAVWFNPDPMHPGTGVQLSGFDAAARTALRAFIDTTEPSRDVVSEIDPSSSDANRPLYDRMRRLSPMERTELARQGSLPERVALERCFGGSVWESLLQNPQLSLREVALFARSGSLSFTLVNLIVQNRGWLSDAGVQQALLTNPRLSGAHVERVLRMLPESEIARIATHPSYRQQVRTAAKRLIVR